MDLHFKDDVAAAPRGSINVKVINREGVIVDSFEDHNLIVDKAREIMAALVGTGVGYLTKFGVGTGTEPALKVDTGLVTPVYTNIVSVAYPAAGQITFNCVVDYADANGLRITEFGLFNAANEMFSHKVRAVVDGESVTGVIDKMSDLKITCAWTLRF